MKQTIIRFLTLKRLPLLLAALALLLVLPSLWTGFQLDDIVHRYFLLGNPDVQGNRLSPLQLFSFLDGDSVRTHERMDIGLLPWWTVPGLRLNFWRPLTGMTHWLDYALWPDNAVLMHLQNLIWFGALIAAVSFLYRRIHGLTWIAGLAALLYAIDDAHGLPVGWLAGRNAIISTLFGVMALLFHDRWRRSGRHSGGIPGSLFLALGLLAGENALAALAYLFSYAVFLDPSGRRDRLLSLVPYASIAFIWMTAYSLLGHGTWGSGFYVDPGSEPLGFIAAVVQRAPLLLLDQFGFPPSAISMVLTPHQATILWVWALIFLSLLALLLLPLVRRDATARFWGTGMLLSVVPICATLPNGRLLFFAGIGAMGLIAQWLAGYADRAEWITGGRFGSGAAVVVLVLVHIIVAPVLLPLTSTSATIGEPYLQRAAENIPEVPDMVHKDLILVNPPVVFYADFIGAVRILDRLPVPRRVRALAPGSTALDIRRSNDRTLFVRPDGGFLSAPFDNVFRGPRNPMRQGEVVRLTNFSVRILKVTDDGRPEEVAFEFGVPLDDASLIWMQWKDGRYVPFVPPSIGSAIHLPPAALF